ncbi:hypothetical protein PINS_up003875 [Pythium insidiosum]|nr:hypothetical protein PINS_up003875 [Pythium insidiosum]
MYVLRAKIVPPKGWFTRSYDLDELPCAVSKPVSQHVAGKKGVFNVDLVERKTMSVADFKKLTDLSASDEPICEDGPVNVDDIERRFWKSLRPTMDAPLYGADIVGSLFGDDDALSWNLSRLDTILQRIDLPGITRPMLYFGMWRAMFAFHTEDMDLYSINYLHTGKPKFWYAVPPQSAAQLERAAQSMFPEKHHSCHQFMRHKTSLISPTRLKEFGVPFYRALQQPGEFVITFPATYHQGFNLGFNIAEAVNFATLRWIPFGLKAKVCKCVPDSVHIDMDVFLTKLFDERANSSAAVLGDDAWVFSCACKQFVSSEEPDFTVEDQWFECSKCKIWGHLHCVHPALAECEASDLPACLLCHRCLEDSNENSVKTKVISINCAEVPVNVSALGKRTRASATNERAKKQSQGAKRSPAGRPARSRLVKGATIQLNDVEARVVAVEGKFVRVHYKGHSADDDEWLPVDSAELRRQGARVASPQRIRRASVASTSTPS